MGFLDHLLDGVTGGGGTPKRLHRNVVAAESLLAEGERASARIVGIRVRVGTDDSPDQHEFALAYASGANADQTRAGCRQALGDLRSKIRLGMEVPIRHDGDGRAIIDSGALGGDPDTAWGYKSLGEPPADGIEDGNFKLEKERRKAVEARVQVLTVERHELLGMATQNFNMRVRVETAGQEPYETIVKRELIPFYALHLAEPGTDLPGLVRPERPDKVRIDWPAAALADPGVGRPPAAAVVPPEEPGDEVMSAGEPADWSAAGLAADDHGEVAGVSFETWVRVEAGLVRDRVKPADHGAYAQRHGVPAGGWAAAQKGWQQRMMTDPRVGARFGTEYQAALKGR